MGDTEHLCTNLYSEGGGVASNTAVSFMKKFSQYAPLMAIIVLMFEQGNFLKPRFSLEKDKKFLLSRNNEPFEFFNVFIFAEIFFNQFQISTCRIQTVAVLFLTR